MRALSTGRFIAAFFITACVLATAEPAAAQYNAQILLPPSEFSQPGALTNAFAMNEAGLVFGEVVLYPNDHRPVVWTDGVGVALPVPDGYYWTNGFDPFGYQFVNNSGLVVSMLRIANGVPNSNWDEKRVVVWQNGVPQVLPLPDSCGQTGTGHQFAFPYGLNNLGQILVGTYGDTPCGKLWLWDGSGYQLFYDNANGAVFNIGTPARTHLNDDDHAAIDRLPGGLSPTCDSNGTITGTMIGTEFTPIAGGSALQINNQDQVFLYCTMESQLRLKLWDGATLVDLGYGGAASMNDLGQVVFLAGPGTALTPKIYKDGVVSDLQLPLFSPTASFVGGSLINSSGQIVLVESLMYGGTNQAVLFTPRTPVITWPKPADITYGTALSPTQLNATANVPGTFVYTPAAGTVLSAAAVQLLSVTFTPSDLVHYDPTSASNSIGVLPTPLSIKADDANKVFGAPLPSFSATFTGFVNGDGPGNLTGSLALTTGATSSSPPGPYAIVPSGVTASNYAISFVNGTLTVAQANTTTSVQALPTATTEFQPVILIATIVPVAPGAGTVDGSVQFKDGASLLGTGTVSNGLAYLLVNGLTPGGHPITAVYAGTGNFGASASQILTVTVQPLASSSFTLLFPLTQPQAIGQSATFAALVVSLGGGPTPTGTVQFTDNNTVRGSAPLNAAGAAIFSMPALGAGTHLIGAQYLGGATYAASTASPVLQTMYAGARPAATALALTTSANPSLVDQPITFTATVTGGATTGPVVFFIDGFALDVAPLADVGGAMKASFTLNGLLAAGQHVISAAYAGSPGFAASTLFVPAVQTIESGGTPSAADRAATELLLERMTQVRRPGL